MRLELARGLNMNIIARARCKRFPVYNRAEQMFFDDRPVVEGA
jgi:hypothetical protein